MHRFLPHVPSPPSPACDDSRPPPTYEPSQAKLSTDPVLTALAQLGVCRLGVDRSFISLIDSKSQYIVAEAGKDSPLAHDRARDSSLDLAFGAGVVDVAFSVCERTIAVFTHGDGRFNLDTPNVQADPSRYWIRDFREHSLFKDRPYVQGWPYMRCYVEVPLKTRDGIVLGSYCVVDNKVRTEIDDNDYEIMHGIARAVVRHLEDTRIKHEHAVAARLLDGLDSYIKGRSELRVNAISGVDDIKPTFFSKPPVFTCNEQIFKSSPKLEATTEMRADALTDDSFTRRGSSNSKTSAADSTTANFARAAGLLKDSMDLSGVVFLDAFSSSVVSRARKLSETRVASAGSPLIDSPRPAFPRSDSDLGHAHGSFAECLYLTSDAHSGKERVPSHFSVPIDVLGSLIERYPRGYTFHFDDQGLIPSLVGSEADEGQDQSVYDTDEARECDSRLEQYFPGATAIIFTPLWAPSREACYAACFGWSTGVRRVFNLSELNFFLAFGHSVMAETARLEALASDKAKSDFISSISHELRSPLHGILGSADLLRESCTEPAQRQMLSMIASCGRTLLDTLNHL